MQLHLHYLTGLKKGLRATIIPWKTLLNLCRLMLLLFVTVCVSSCKTRVVVVNSDDIVRLGEDVKGHVYFWNGTNWVKSSNKVKLPEGWYAGAASTR
ncbi:MAG: hypothetical protein N2645_11700 [Clostridia bacterium]|nr:hypothetical protein [Clostridia bacterium]